MNRLAAHMAAAAPASPRVALIHDFLLDIRGAERVFMAICDVWPDADVYTAVYDEEGTEGRFAHRPINTSFLQRLRPTAKTFRPLLPLYPYAIESFDLGGYDIVVSSSSAWAHGVIVDEGALHVCYCHNPFRYAWNARDETLRGRNGLGRATLSVVFNRWRQWDWIAAQRVDRYVANSHTTSRRIAPLLQPRRRRALPAGGDRALHARRVGRLLPGRLGAHAAQADLGGRGGLRPPGPAARGRGRRPRRPPPAPHGPGQHRLRGPGQRRARGPAVRGRTGAGGDRDRGVRDRRRRGPGRRPPGDRLRRGRRAETVLEGETGTLFHPCRPEALAEAVRRFDADTLSSQACIDNAMRFDVRRFQAGLRAIVEEASELERPPRPLSRPRGRGRLRPVLVEPSG